MGHFSEEHGSLWVEVKFTLQDMVHVHSSLVEDTLLVLLVGLVRLLLLGRSDAVRELLIVYFVPGGSWTVSARGYGRRQLLIVTHVGHEGAGALVVAQILHRRHLLLQHWVAEEALVDHRMRSATHHQAGVGQVLLEVHHLGGRRVHLLRQQRGTQVIGCWHGVLGGQQV